MSSALFNISWHNVANVMYVDQPVGTGLSFTTSDNYADNDLQVRCALRPKENDERLLHESRVND